MSAQRHIPVSQPERKLSSIFPPPQVVNRPAAIEICGNNIDDDNNGLTDEKDFSCYYSNVGQDGCVPSKIVWGASGPDLYWVDMETGTYKYVGNMWGLNIFDLTWTSDGKLYILDAGNNMLWEVDPYTATVTPTNYIRSFTFDNSLTSDNEGNIYSTGWLYSSPFQYCVFKLNLATGQASFVADLSAAGLTSASDLCFLGGKLYLTCTNRKMAVINTNTGAIESFSLTNSTTDGAFGLVTLGDGFLYQCDKDKIYRIDPLTMRVDSEPAFDFNKPDSIGFAGLSSYVEHCNAPDCKASLNIDILSSQPFCSAKGVELNANGRGIRGETKYEWQLPDGSTQAGKSIVAKLSGKYYVQYLGVTDFCAAKDSVVLNLTQSPEVDLGADQILCKGKTLQLSPLFKPSNSSITWQDGTTKPVYTVTSPGKYSVQLSNVCGIAKDTVVVSELSIPKVDLGFDSSICPGSTIVLNNLSAMQPDNSYQWSNNSTSNSLITGSPGIYWLQSSNNCGTTRDSVVVSFKDSCTCFPFYPTADLGPDVEICYYDSIQLKNLTHKDGYRYHWSTGGQSLQEIIKGKGVYWVEVSTYCSSVKDTIVFSEKTSGCERNVFIPSASFLAECPILS